MQLHQCSFTKQQLSHSLLGPCPPLPDKASAQNHLPSFPYLSCLKALPPSFSTAYTKAPATLSWPL